MLKEHQVKYLLLTCERLLRRRLDRIRGQLRASDPTSGIWELVVIEAALARGEVEYERTSTLGKTIDLYIPFPEDKPLWFELGYVRERFPEVEDRALALAEMLARLETERGIKPGAISFAVQGQPSRAGVTSKLPASQELRGVFGRQELRQFLATIKQTPQSPTSCDLGPLGYTLIFTYSPSPPGPVAIRSWSSSVADSPTFVSEHVAYRVLREKAQYAKAAGIEEPLVVFLGSHGSRPMQTTRGLRASRSTITREQAVTSALKRWPMISAAVLCPLSTSSGRIEVAIFKNPDATRPLTAAHESYIDGLDFNRIEYNRFLRTNRVKRLTPAERRRREGGSMKEAFSKDSASIEIPATMLSQLLAGEIAWESIAKEYEHACLREPFENPFSTALRQNRSLQMVTYDPRDPTKQEPPSVRFEYGPPEEPILQVPKP